MFPSIISITCRWTFNKPKMFKKLKTTYIEALIFCYHRSRAQFQFSPQSLYVSGNWNWFWITNLDFLSFQNWKHRHLCVMLNVCVMHRKIPVMFCTYVSITKCQAEKLNVIFTLMNELMVFACCQTWHCYNGYNKIVNYFPNRFTKTKTISDNCWIQCNAIFSSWIGVSFLGENNQQK